MTITITHAKTNNITNWTQGQLNTIIAGGAAPLPPPGTVLNDVVLPSDWNNSHVVVGAVEGPASATDNAIARYDATTGKLIQDSGVTISDTANIILQDAKWIGGSLNNSFGLTSTGVTVANTSASMYFNVDSDGSSTDQAFIIGKDRTGLSGGTEILRAEESGFVGIGATGAGVAYPLQVRRAGGAGSLGISINNIVTSCDVLYYSIGDLTNVTTGHAFYVRNSSATDNLALAINNLGQIGVNNATPLFDIDVIGSDIAVTRYVDTTGGPTNRQRKARGTTPGTATIVLSGDSLGSFSYWGYDGVNFINAGFIRGAVDGTPGTNDMPGRLEFATTPDGAAASTVRMTIDNAGIVTTSNTTDSTLFSNGSVVLSGGLGVAKQIRTNTSVAANTSISAGTTVLAGSSSFIGLTSRSRFSAPSDGVMTVTNAANNDFTRLQLGGTTSSFPSIKRNSAAINFRLADDTADADITAGNITPSGKVVKREVSVADATSITPNIDTSDVVTQANTQAVGTLTVNAPTGTKSPSQGLLIRIKSTNVQTFAWNGAFRGGTTALPTATSGTSKTDYYAFIWNSADSTWDYSGGAGGF